MASRLRYIIGVGFWNVSDSVDTGNSAGKPPASHTPRLTCSARSRRCMWQGLMSDQVLRMAMKGLPPCSSAPKPSWRIRERWLNERSPSPPNHRWLRSSSGFFVTPAAVAVPACSPHALRMAVTCARTSPGKGRLGGRTSERHRPSWASASLTTLTLSAEESAARRSSNGRTDSHTFIATLKSPARSASSMAMDSAGATLTSPEVKPWAPTAQYPGACSSARPAIQVNLSSPASLATDANLTGSGTAYLIPITFRQLSPSRPISVPPMRESRT